MGNYIGYTMEMALGRAATADQAGNEALTFFDVEGYSAVPTNRLSTADIDTPDLYTGIVTGQKGMATGQSQTIAFSTTLSNTGQADVIAASKQSYDGEVTFRIGRKAGVDEVEYINGILRNYLPKEGTGESDDGFTVDFRQNSEGLIATRPT